MRASPVDDAVSLELATRSVASRAECCSLTLEDLELVKQFTPRELGWWP